MDIGLAGVFVLVRRPERKRLVILAFPGGNVGIDPVRYS